MIIMAFDVSLHRTGVAVLDDGRLVGTDVIPTSAIDERHARLWQLALAAAVLMGHHRPHIVVVETSAPWQKLSHDSRISIEALAQARAAVLIAVTWAMTEYLVNPRVVQMDPNDVREMLCANRRADKREVAKNLRQRGYTLPLGRNGIIDYDVSDALACALTCHYQERLLAMKEV